MVGGGVHDAVLVQVVLRLEAEECLVRASVAREVMGGGVTTGDIAAITNTPPRRRREYRKGREKGTREYRQKSYANATIHTMFTTPTRNPPPPPVLTPFDFLLSTIAHGGPCDLPTHNITHLTSDQLNQILTIAPQTSDGTPTLHNPNFKNVTLTGDANFHKTTFEGDANFDGATFKSETNFDRATFKSETNFNKATFTGETNFNKATFTDKANFDKATFTDKANFSWIAFTGKASFRKATFTGKANFVVTAFEGWTSFSWTKFKSETSFLWATFKSEANFGRATFEGETNFSGATFKSETNFDEAKFKSETNFGWATFTGKVRFDRTRFSERKAAEKGNVVGGIIAEKGSVVGGIIAEKKSVVGGVIFDRVEILSGLVFRGVPNELLRFDGSFKETDLARVEFVNVDLANCFFENATGLDQAKLRGETSFDRTRKRERLADEVKLHDSDMPKEEESKEAERVKAKHFAQLYRDLRKGREDAKNEPGAADFYYGEMEMRRRSDSWGTRRLLDAYWAVSGYGLRPLRSLIALLVVMCGATFVLNAFGFQDSVGSSRGNPFLFVVGSLVSMTTFDTGVLTTTGQGVRVVLRLVGPVLLGLTVLTVRGQVKR